MRLQSSFQNGLSRRDALLLSAAGLYGAVGRSWLSGVVNGADVAPRPKSCIVLWLSGGPSQIDTVDMKPDAPVETRGEFKPIDSALPGVPVCEHLSRLAKALDRFALIRSIRTTNGRPSHDAANRLMRFGLTGGGRDTIDRPNWGSVVSAGRTHPETGLPNFLVVGGVPGRGAGNLSSGFLGFRHAPMLIADPTQGLPNLASRLAPESAVDRIALLDAANRDFLSRSGGSAAESHRSNEEAAVALMRSPAATAFDLSKEPAKLRDAYGRHHLGQGALLARRLVEIGVPFVEVTYPNTPSMDGGWDTHNKNFPTLKNLLLPQLDSALTTLIEDLKDRGLLDSTLVVAMGEMGRTPKVTRDGRDHFCNAFSALVAGGGVKVGQVIGSTTADGMDIKDRPINAAEFLSTVCRVLGVDGKTEYDASTGKPIKGDGMMVPPLSRTTLFSTAAKPVKELFG